MDEIERREMMEASENRELPRGGWAPHRVDPDQVAKTLTSGANPAGYARLELMVSTIFDRLVADERNGLAES